MADDKADGNQARSRHHWEAHIRAQQKGGLSRAEYCRRNDLSCHALTYWRRKLSGSSSGKSQLVPVPMEKILRSRQPAAATSGVKILLNDRIAIEVAEEFSPKTLNRILSVLENR
jgi:hypothetical protein